MQIGDDNPSKRFVEPSAIGAILVPVSRMCDEAFYVSRATTKKRLIVADRRLQSFAERGAPRGQIQSLIRGRAGLFDRGKHAWNGFDRNFDPGILRGLAEMVSQPTVGLCPDRGSGSRPSHCGRSRAPGTYLDFRLERGLRRWIAKRW